MTRRKVDHQSLIMQSLKLVAKSPRKTLCPSLPHLLSKLELQSMIQAAISAEEVAMSDQVAPSLSLM